jgi:hypothetical protein
MQAADVLTCSLKSNASDFQAEQLREKGSVQEPVAASLGSFLAAQTFQPERGRCGDSNRPHPATSCGTFFC